MPAVVTCKFEEEPIKMKELRCPQYFPYFKSMGATGCRGNKSCDLVWPKTVYSFSPLQFHYTQFDQVLPTGLKDAVFSILTFSVTNEYTISNMLDVRSHFQRQHFFVVTVVFSSPSLSLSLSGLTPVNKYFTVI